MNSSMNRDDIGALIVYNICEIPVLNMSDDYIKHFFYS